ncbi:MAG TPA: PqqD family protein [Desulfobacterales bacterium]|nr:PqqD family protein [Desulfobacterales bacterium]
MLEIKQNDSFILAENIFLQKITELEKYWVFNIDTGEHYTLNETSYWILEQIAENLSAKNILKHFVGYFDVDENQSKDDFLEIVNGFLTEGIIKRREKDGKR